MKPLRSFRHFLKDRSGATALEFSMVAVPFIIAMLAMFEYGLVYLCQVSLDDATAASARQIRTGEAQSGNASASTFKAAICARMGWLQSTCPSSLFVDVRTLSNFQNPGALNPIVNGKFKSTNLTYDDGAACSIVIVRAFYQWPLVTTALQAGLANMNGNVDVLTATTAFRNEPYDPNDATQC